MHRKRKLLRLFDLICVFSVVDGVGRAINATFDPAVGTVYSLICYLSFQIYFQYTLPCGSTPGDIVITIGGGQFPINYRNYLVPYAGRCIVAMFALNFGSGFGPTWIMGKSYIYMSFIYLSII